MYLMLMSAQAGFALGYLGLTKRPEPAATVRKMGPT